MKVLNNELEGIMSMDEIICKNIQENDKSIHPVFWVSANNEQYETEETNMVTK